MQLIESFVIALILITFLIFVSSIIFSMVLTIVEMVKNK